MSIRIKREHTPGSNPESTARRKYGPMGEALPNHGRYSSRRGLARPQMLAGWARPCSAVGADPVVRPCLAEGIWWLGRGLAPPWAPVQHAGPCLASPEGIMHRALQLHLASV
eukprot:361994-Chlamydomonas_euryale.AAC.2